MPESAVESFAGVANPWQLGRLNAGERVLDLGSGAGTDSLVAAQMVGEQGHVTGIDMTTAMLAKARSAAAEVGVTNVEFVEAEAEQLPFPDESFDVVISNGVIDLIPDKDAVFSEISRVLAPGGHPGRRRDDPEPGQRGRPPEHRPLDRLNSRGAAGSSVRQAPGTTRVRADRDRSARRHVRALEVRKTRGARRRSSALGAPPSRRIKRAREFSDGCNQRARSGGAHLAALRRLGDFHDKRVLELGCGDGRLTLGLAVEVASALAFDPDAEAVERARRFLPEALADRVEYEVACGKEIEIEPHSFDFAVFSWSL